MLYVIIESRIFVHVKLLLYSKSYKKRSSERETCTKRRIFYKIVIRNAKTEDFRTGRSMFAVPRADNSGRLQNALGASDQRCDYSTGFGGSTDAGPVGSKGALRNAGGAGKANPIYVLI